MSSPLQGFAEVAQKAAAEGAVLLKNENQVLPILGNEKISLFGRCQIDYYCCGTGSGGMVNTAYKTNPLAELRARGKAVNEGLAAVYEKWVTENPVNKGDGAFASEPWFQEEMPLTEDIVKAARLVSEKAIIIIGRTAGEETDNHEVAGSLLLTEKEEAMISLVTAQFSKVCLVLNVSNIIDFGFMAADKFGEKIDTLLLAWQGGQEGGRALADLLLANITPSGKLPDTIAVSIPDYPSSPYYGDEVSNAYVEDIYVGYRYFETFCPDKVLYEFGFGLSYTDFAVNVKSAVIDNNEINLIINVKNTGADFTGKEVVQIYYEAPQGKLGQPARQLLAYQKSALLKPGEEQDLSFAIDVAKMRTYDDSGVTGNKSAYVLEAGDYHIYAGTSVRNNEKVTTLNIPELRVIERLTEALAPEKDFERMKPGQQKSDGTYELTFEAVPKKTINLRERVNANLPKEIKQTGNKGILLKDVKSGQAGLNDFIAQLSNHELATLVRGEGIGHPEVMEGTTSAFGSVSESLIGYGIPLACTADGPSGIRLDGGHLATLMPIGTLLAAGFNDELVEELYTFEGRECYGYDIDTLLGPGMNLHRNPRNGRNFEYYSEDPLLTGQMAKAAVLGLEAGGCPGTIKHFACNNQEIKRREADSVVSERAVREIYLRGFEIAVKEGKARSLMTSYNPLNGHWTASNYDLNTTILRGEWGFPGIVMTDWWAAMNNVEEGGEDAENKLRDMVRAGNDLYMPVNNYGADINSAGDDIEESLENSTLTVGELQDRAKYILTFLMKSKAMERKREVLMAVIDLEPLDNEAVEEMLREAPASDNNEEVITYDVPVVMSQNIFFEVKIPGLYSIQAHMLSKNFCTAQTAGQLYINDEPAALISCRGTMGKWVKQIVIKARFKSGFYSLRVEETRPHFEVDNIHFEPIVEAKPTH
ncbi:MAG: glycoside hydrolase family 3 C-terminal domain-containing protein [Lachnospiraceae bacterium]|nr:glycoside hydrolase family 3 C-terminal domain-containing protein [Lachnospiraceae bacterium]